MNINSKSISIAIHYRKIKVPVYKLELINPTDTVVTQWEHDLPPRELTNIKGQAYWRTQI